MLGKSWPSWGLARQGLSAESLLFPPRQASAPALHPVGNLVPLKGILSLGLLADSVFGFFPVLLSSN